MADLRISQLPGIDAAALQGDDVVATVDISASETKKITVKDLVQKSVTLIDAGSIPGDKVTFSLPDGSVGTLQLADGSVTGIKLADNSTALIQSPLPATGQFIGQLGIDGDDPSIWNGSVWLPFVTGIVSITGGKIGPVTTTATVIGDQASVLAKIDDAAVPAGFVAGPTASAGPVEVRPIVPGDLPIAQTTTAGIVSVPSGGGLTIDGGASGLGSDLVIDNDIAAGSNQLVSYSTKGLVVGGRAIEGGDLPIATNGSVGAVSAGPEFTVTPAGELNLANIVSPGTFAVVTYNGNGLITAGRDLTESDIPELDANKITSGTFPTDLLADRSVTVDKLADYAVSYIQEASPSTTDPGHIGCLWYQESTGQLRMWNGNSWMPVGFGRLSNDNLRWGGIVDASTGLVTGITSSGSNAGLEIGQPLPEASNTLGGLYVVIGEPGDQVTVTPGVSYDAGDWCLCINEAEGWTRIDTMAGGGGGGASTLADLLDVTLTGVTNGQYLQYQASGQWTNVDITAADVGALAPGDNVSELNNDAGYLDQAEVNNILEGKNPDGTPDPNAPEYITSDELTAAIGDGTISITKSDGTPVGEFTVNQSGDTSIALPADVVPAAPGNGQLEIKDSDGNSLGTFTANQATGTNTDITLPAAAAVYWTEGTDQLYPTTASNSILIGGVLPSAPNITLESSGSATFAGRVNALRFLSIGPTATDKVWSGYLTNTSGAATSYINADGSATFTGNVNVGDDIFLSASAGYVNALGFNAGSGKALIKGDTGSATFAGNVHVGGPNVDVLGETLRFTRGDNAAIRYHSIYAKHSGDANTNTLAFYIHDAADVTSQKEVLTLRGNGNVGIGLGDPSGKLDVQNGANRAIKFEVDPVSGDNHIKSYQGTSELLRKVRISAEAFAVNTANSTEDAGDTRLTILNNGNCGIGEDNPGEKLIVSDADGKGIRSHCPFIQGTDANKALRVTNGDDTNTFSVSYKGKVTAQSFDLESLPELP